MQGSYSVAEHDLTLSIQKAESWQLLHYVGTDKNQSTAMMQITSAILHTSVSSVIILQW